MKPKMLSLLVSKRSQSSKQPLVKSNCSIHNHASVASVKGQSLDQIFCALALETETENCFQDIVFGCFKQSHRHVLYGGHNVPERISVCAQGYSLNGLNLVYLHM